MKLLITSDAHGDMETLLDIIKKHADRDNHLDAGDMVLPKSFIERHGIITVKGNNDFGLDLPLARVLDLGHLKVLLTHGHKEGVKFSLTKLMDLAHQNQVDLCIYGHTHISYMKHEQHVLFINPGAVTGHKSYAIYQEGTLTFHTR